MEELTLDNFNYRKQDKMRLTALKYTPIRKKQTETITKNYLCIGNIQTPVSYTQTQIMTGYAQFLSLK